MSNKRDEVTVQNYPDLYVTYKECYIKHPVSELAPVLKTSYVVKSPSMVLGDLMSQNTEYAEGTVELVFGRAVARLGYQQIIDSGITDSMQQYWSSLNQVFSEFDWSWNGDGIWYVDLDMTLDSAENPDEYTVVQQYIFDSTDNVPVEYGVEAVNAFSYAPLLNMVVFRSVDDSLPVKIYSNGGDHLVINEHIDQAIPSNIEFVPAYSWDGSEKEYTESEMDVSGN